MNRRKLLQLSSVAPLYILNSCHAKDNNIESITKAQHKFVSWLKPYQSEAGNGLFPYMAQSDTKTLSIVASTKLVLFFLRIHDIASAKKIANGLVYWLEQSKRQPSRFAKGGLPTEIRLNHAKPLGDYYYASDNLLTIRAFHELYKVTGDARYAESAITLGHWLEQNLFSGVRHQLWGTDFGPPMHYLTTAGVFDNSIHTAGDFLWLVALKDLHELEPNHGWQERLNKATLFMQSAQMPSGAWYTFFRPTGFKKAGKWYNFRGDNITIGDDNLRSALAAHQFGMSQQVEHFKKWLQPFDDTLLWGYLNTQKSLPQFLASDTPYFDVVCTGLLRSWYRKVGQTELADKCQSMSIKLQAADGGWHWAAKQSDLKPLNDEKAIITGCWSLVDII